MTEAPQSNSDGSISRRVPHKRELTLFQAVALTVVGALVAAVAVLTVMIWWLGLSSKIAKSTGSVISLTQLAFALVAGVGATTGLVIAYRKHQLDTGAEAREDQRLFNERFGTAATQLASNLPAVRLAGIYSMAGLADDWIGGRQQCIEVLCANLRRAYEPEPSDTAAGAFDAARLAWKDNQEFRHTLVRAIAQRLRPDSKISWQGHSFDFTGAVFDGGDFSRIHVNTGTTLRFSAAQFVGGSVGFNAAEITGGLLDFDRAQLIGGTVDFSGAKLAAGVVNFAGARFSNGKLDFTTARFSAGAIIFHKARFEGAGISFFGSQFLGAGVNLTLTTFEAGNMFLDQAEFAAGSISFFHATFKGGFIGFTAARFAGAEIDFARSKFAGGLVTFAQAEFTAGRVDLSEASMHAQWPVFPFDPDQPPPVVLLPPRPSSTAGQSGPS